MSSNVHTKYHYSQGRTRLCYIHRHTELMLGLAMQRMIFFRTAATAVAEAAALQLIHSCPEGKISSQVCFYNEEEVMVSSLPLQLLLSKELPAHALGPLSQFHCRFLSSGGILGEKNNTLACTLCFCYLSFHRKPHFWTEGITGNKTVTVGYTISTGHGGIWWLLSGALQ